MPLFRKGASKKMAFLTETSAKALTPHPLANYVSGHIDFMLVFFYMYKFVYMYICFWNKKGLKWMFLKERNFLFVQEQAMNPEKASNEDTVTEDLI